MADSFIRTSGNEVFDGNQLGLKSFDFNYTYNRLTNAPSQPSSWQLAEVDSVGFANPRLTVKGLIDGTKTHGQNETGSVVDFNFLNELVASSGLKYLQDDFYKPVSGSEFLVEVDNFTIPQRADRQEEANVRSETTKYTLRLVIASGTPWWSGTGIV